MDEAADYAALAALASLDKYVFENVSGDVRTSVSKEEEEEEEEDDDDDDDDDDNEDHDDELKMPTTADVGTIGRVEGEDELFAVALLAEEFLDGTPATACQLVALRAAVAEIKAEDSNEPLVVAAEPSEEKSREIVLSLESLRRDKLLPFSKKGDLLSCVGNCKRACLARLLLADATSMLRLRKRALWLADAAGRKFAANDGVAAPSQWGGQGGGKRTHATIRAVAKPPPRDGADAPKGKDRLAPASSRAGAREVMEARRQKDEEGEGDGPSPPKRLRAGSDVEELSTQQELPRSLPEARKSREIFAADLALKLRAVPVGEDKPLCCWGAVLFASATSFDYWYDKPKGQGGQTRLELLELASYRRRTRDRAGMVPWVLLTGEQCGCPQNCHSLNLESVLKTRYDELCDCESLRDENAVVSRLLVDDLGQRTSVCLPFLESWLLFPASFQFLSFLLAEALRALRIHCNLRYCYPEICAHYHHIQIS
jgi:hypothetical protein